MLENKLFLCRSYYHILIALYQYFIKGSRVTIVCVEKNFNYKKLKELECRINNMNLDISFHIISQEYETYKNFLNLGVTSVYFFHWVIYKKPEYDFYNCYKKQGINLIEDGVTHYAVYQNDYKTRKIYMKFIINYILLGKKDLALSNNIKNIYVTVPEKYPYYLSNKINKINFDLSLLSNKQRTLLLSIFNIHIDNVKDNMPKSIIFTQPFDIDGYMTEKDKLLIYEEIVSDLIKSGHHVFIKPHPRDLSDYKFKGEVTVLDSSFPGELLNYLDLKLNKAIAVCSGVIHHIKAEEKIQTDKEFFTRKRK